MEAGEAYERRVWRIALLLTDDADAARSILADVVRTQPDLAKIGDTRLDRMVVQAARTHAGDGPKLGELLTLENPAAELWSAVRDLAEQPREAWVFRTLEGLEPIRAARAMDCSRTAMEEVHLVGATRVLEARLGESLAPATASLTQALPALESTDALRAALDHAGDARANALKRRRRNSVALLAVLLVCFGLMIYVLISLLGWDEKNLMNKAEIDRYSNPRQEAPAGTEIETDAP